MSFNTNDLVPNWSKASEILKDVNESLATVMRHDQDHDDWHRMHGDAPCTSEADCAQKRAKYAEVKAEQSVTKGDLPGHEFHGNQWSQARSQNDNLKIANNLHLQHSDQSDPSDVAAQHEIAAGLHRQMSVTLRTLAQEALDKGHPTTSGALRQAAEYHAEAANAHLDAAKATAANGISRQSIEQAFPAVRASRLATSATDDALDLAQSVGVAPVVSRFS